MKIARFAARMSFFAAVILAITQSASAKAQSDYLDFRGRFLAVLSDADMEASAYIDNQLGERSPGLTDTLTLIPLTRGLAREPITRPITLPVSNSVMAWPNNLAFTPDEKYAFVTETFAPAPKGATLRSDIPSGRLLTVIDLRNPQHPKIIDQLDLGNQPRPVAVHPAGNLLAVSLRDPRRQIALIPFSNGELGTPIFQNLPGINDPEANASHLEWHPSGQFLGVTLADRNEAVFYAVDRTNSSRPNLRAWGQPIMTGKLPGVGHFTPDGRHFIVTNLLWGDDVADQFVGSQHSDLTVINFAESANSRNEVAHRIVSTAAVGGSAEEFAISPDGRFVVSLNMEASYLPQSDQRMTWHSSLTLLSLNSDTGRLTPRTTVPFEGILPEGITFDASGRYLAVATFDHHNPARSGGTVDFWRVLQGEVPSLLKMDYVIPVMRGAHIVKLVQ
ncbi:beta-propeller fold lactonase family protein [Leptolyngbya sp. FACHB-261]|uniref:beta-propeller fold lactonase family protein n=1 Tax=Leptolyngbya sp. FACHB-261 TaxID=2692806 RepID=UPI0016859686|nr:beta-propeller fold lactonase family protein [Leptolyngbya sp. FACHB-261]MBD2102344.1 beta-propeller fold lactonase family protein [Leptolyngbya sp. FACHB-261]